LADNHFRYFPITLKSIPNLAYLNLKDNSYLPEPLQRDILGTENIKEFFEGLTNEKLIEFDKLDHQNTMKEVFTALGYSKASIHSTDRLKLFKNLLQISKSNIPLPVLMERLDFSSLNELQDWLTQLDLGGFQIDWESNMLHISDEIPEAIDQLLQMYEVIEDKKDKKL
jgi:hypothetical protein